MKKILIMAVLLIVGTAAMAQQQAYTNFVNVTGTAERQIVPDEIYLNITIDESASKGKITVAEQENKMISALRNLGIDVEKDLRVGDIAGDLHTYILRKDRVLTTKSYSLKVGNASVLADVFKVLANLGITEAAVTKATHSDIEQIRMELRAEAMRSAQANAKALAGAVGQTIGKAFQINEYSYGGAVMYSFDDAYLSRAKGVAMEAETSLDFKELKITHSVNVMFVLE